VDRACVCAVDELCVCELSRASHVDKIRRHERQWADPGRDHRVRSAAQHGRLHSVASDPLRLDA